MKRTVLLSCLFILAAGGVHAQETGRLGVGVGVTSAGAGFLAKELVGKVYAKKKFAIRLLFGFETSNNGRSTTDLALGGGIEYHLRMSKVSPYIVGDIGFQSLESEGDITSLTIFGGWGVEYWFEKNLSMNGEAGLAFSSRSGAQDEVIFGTVQSAIRLIYYF